MIDKIKCLFGCHKFKKYEDIRWLDALVTAEVFNCNRCGLTKVTLHYLYYCPLHKYSENIFLKKLTKEKLGQLLNKLKKDGFKNIID